MMRNKISIAHLPTPVENLDRLSTFMNGPRILVKRDDQTGLAFGGNKTRKLEFLVADALAQGVQTLITGGAIQSNHCRQTAAAAARTGLACILVLTGEPPEKPSGNLMFDHLFGAEIHFTTSLERDATMQAVYDTAYEAGRKPYLIPYGGSNAIGALGYVQAMEETLNQGFVPDWHVFASSSGGTHAGLVVGGRMYGYRGRILGISIDEHESVLKNRVANLAQEVLTMLDVDELVSPDEVLVNDQYLGVGYGMMAEPEIEAIQLFAHLEGLLLDPVYTGRAAAGLLDLIRKGFFKREETILFWHTGGGPALLADRYRDGLLG